MVVEAAQVMRPTDLDDLLAMDRDDVLSVALNTDPARPENQAAHPAYQIWLTNALRDLLAELPARRRRQARPTVERVTHYVATWKPAGRGIALFAARGLWRTLTLQVPLPHRVRYGQPDVTAVLEALDEHRPYAILAVDHRRARLALGYLGNATLLAEEKLDLHTEYWRRTTGRRPTAARRLGEGAGRGNQHDEFDARLEAHYRAFWEHVAHEAERAMAARGLDRLVIGGPAEAASAVARLLPPDRRRTVVATVPLPLYRGLPEMLRRTLQVAVEAERRRDRALVADALEAAGSQRAVLGWPAVHEALRVGQVHALVVDRTVLARHPELPRSARAAGARLELVDADAAAPLHAHGGIAALLRHPTSRGG
ncbi:MAG: VLRF1 family aeRF1-type release factor [Armatimonadota bacterium]|nr:VLRF1 family aeRF1-type release factor [Armatimonadota bacterium]MDR7485467.1 VLRF1 family aeRF1-type release factor [Armatimonadota bacterium]MDR7533012.1 VLRF1 family aeRF1-type release factor [Armatimonadota bacterium]MDR7536816.1 VLRF1 family aeRF1-type release factor [Armatimonadota bacterium]